MATKLDSMPQKRHGHPWDEWADGSAWMIHQGTDFTSQLESMRVRLYGKARELGCDLDIQVDKQAQTITFQFTKKEEV